MASGHSCADADSRARAPLPLLGRFALLLCFTWNIAATDTRAQTPTDGALSGRIAQTGAQVIARSASTGLEQSATSGTHGEFLLVHLPPGAYELTVRTAQGEKLALAGAPASVEAGEVTELDLASQSGTGSAPRSLREGVQAEEQGSGLPLDPAEGQAVRGVDPTQNSLHVDGVAAEESFGSQPLGGGVSEAEDGGTDAPREASAGPGSGWRSVESGGRRAGAAYVFSQAAVREFRVEGQSDAASFGSALYAHGVGGVITGVSRSGEQHVHGMSFYTVRSSAWAAADPFNVASTYSNGVVTSTVVKPNDLRQQFGGRIGGPVPLWPRPDNTGSSYKLAERRERQLKRTGRMQEDNARSGEPRLFYLYAFDVQRRRFPAVSSPGDPNFYRLTAVERALLANRGVSAAATNAALNYLASLTGTVDRHANQTVNFGRLDWQRTTRERLIGEYNRVRWSNPAGARTSAVVSRGVASLGSSFGAVDMAVARWVRFLTPRLSHELRVQSGRELQYETAQTPLAQEPAIGPGGLPPEVAIGPNGLVFGTPAGLGQRAYPQESRLEAAEVATWTHGAHLLQLGADFSEIRDFTDSLTNAEGTFSYDSGSSGGKAGGLVDWITDYTFNVHAYPNGGCPSIYATVHDFCFRSFSQSFGQQSVRFARQEWAGFVQEDWTAASSLTVHAGVRYEYGFLPMPQRPNPAIDAVFGATGATSVFPEDRNNVGPRLGLEWRIPAAVGGVMRLGYGVYFGRLPGATVQAALLDTSTASSVSRVRIVPKTETVCPQAVGVGFGYPCAYLATPAGAVAATTSAVVFDRRFRLPMVQQGTVAVEHGIGGGMLVRAGYVANLDRQLPGSTDINIAPAQGDKVYALSGVAGRSGMQDGQTFAVPLYTARLSPSFGTVTDVVSNANATYHGGWIEARRGFGGMRTGGAGRGRGIEFRARWTWSKAIDFGPNASATPQSDAQFDPFTVRYDKGLSALSQPHRVTGSVVWTPRVEAIFPTLAERPRLRVLEDGWSFAGIVEEASGRPYSYEIFGGTRLAGGRETINGSGGSTVLPTVGRNTLRLPDRSNVDVRVTREVRLGERVRGVVTVDGYNVANHRNVSAVQQRAFLVGTAANGVTPLVFQDAAAVAAEGLNVEPFGTFASATSGTRGRRELELSLRVLF